MPGQPACATCQRPFTDPVQAGAVCAPCQQTRPLHSGIFAATLYNDPARRLVLSFKRGRRIALSGLLGRMMAARLPQVGSDWLVVPVPLHRWRLWQRGFNQSALLAHAIVRHSGARLLVDALERSRATRSLGGLGRRERARVLRGAIAVRPGVRDALAGKRIVLVDDVLTSGATSDACVSALLRAGAAEVVVACFARVLPEIATRPGPIR